MKKTKEVTGSILSIHVGNNEDMSKQSTQSIFVELDGFPNDKHQGYSRTAFEGESVPEGTARRNDRQWSAVSIEELRIIEKLMQLSSPLLPSVLGANLCFQGIPDFSGCKAGFSRGAFGAAREIKIGIKQRWDVIKVHKKQDANRKGNGESKNGIDDKIIWKWEQR